MYSSIFMKIQQNNNQQLLVYTAFGTGGGGMKLLFFTNGFIAKKAPLKCIRNSASGRLPHNYGWFRVWLQFKSCHIMGWLLADRAYISYGETVSLDSYLHYLESWTSAIWQLYPQYLQWWCCIVYIYARFLLLVVKRDSGIQLSTVDLSSFVCCCECFSNRNPQIRLRFG